MLIKSDLISNYVVEASTAGFPVGKWPKDVFVQYPNKMMYFKFHILEYYQGDVVSAKYICNICYGSVTLTVLND